MYWSAIIGDIVGTALLYSAFPMIFSIIQKQPIVRTKYRNYCIGYVITIWLLLSILEDVAYGHVANGSPAVLWGIVFYNIGISVLKKRRKLISGKLPPAIPQENQNTGKEIVFEYTSKFQVSRPQETPKKRNNQVSIILSVFLMIFVGISGLLGWNVYKLGAENEKLDEKIESQVRLNYDYRQRMTVYADEVKKYIEDHKSPDNTLNFDQNELYAETQDILK